MRARTRDDPSCATSLPDPNESKHSIQQPTDASPQTTRRTCGVPPLCLQPVEMLRDERVNPPIEWRVRVRVSEDGHRRYACTATAGSISRPRLLKLAPHTRPPVRLRRRARRRAPPPCAPPAMCVCARRVCARVQPRSPCMRHGHAHGGVSHAAWYSCLPRTLGTSSPCRRRSPPLRAHPTHGPRPRAQPTRIGPMSRGAAPRADVPGTASAAGRRTAVPAWDDRAGGRQMGCGLHRSMCWSRAGTARRVP